MKSFNVAVGNGALRNTNPTLQSGGTLTNGGYNTAVGSLAGYKNVTGFDLSFLGYKADVSDTFFSNSTAIGAHAIVRGSNQLILGGNTPSTAHNDVNVGIGLSNAPVGPQSKLEINSDPASNSYTGTTGSGLQFRQLLSTSSIADPDNYFPPYGLVLTVDTDGIVKLTDDPINMIAYGLCSGTPTTLTDDIGMITNDKRIYYDGMGYTGNANDMNNSIGLGYTCGTTLPGKLSVDQTYTSSNVDAPTAAGFFHNGDLTSSASADLIKRSVGATCDGINAPSGAGLKLTNIGGDFKARNCEQVNIGVSGLASHSGSNSEILNVGGMFVANSADKDDYGVYALTDGLGSNTNYGIYAYTPRGSCGTGSCANAAGFFNGDVYLMYSYYVSDATLKDNIQPLQNNLAIIKALNPKSYTFRVNEFPYMSLPSGTQDGLIAQDVENILPGLVGHVKVPSRLDSLGIADTTGSNTAYKAVNYVGIIPYLIGGMKEQQIKIDSLGGLVDSLKANDSIMNSRLNDLEQQIHNCCSVGNAAAHTTNPNGIDVTLASENTIILNQNSPNPFAEQTHISYAVPPDVKDAKIIFFDNLGRVLQTVTINERGNGQLNVFAEKLSSGIYSYTLIADGKVIDTKKMVCSK